MTEIQEDTRWRFTFPADRIDEFLHLIAKANRKLERAGATARFDPSITIEDRVETLESGIQVTVSMATAVMDTFRLALGDYTFVARLVPEEAGMTVHTAPGQSLEGWVRPAAGDMTCEHCNTARNRVNLFVVREDSTGKLIQLGQQCIALYTGIEPKGLWALNFDAEIDDWAQGASGGGGSYREYAADINQVLGLALALTDGGKGYVSKARAEEWGKPSTGGDIARCIFQVGIPTRSEALKSEWAAKERERLLSATSDGLALATDEALMAEVKAAAGTLKAGSDYADNMAIILTAESGKVSRRNISTLGSLVAVYYRNKEQRAEREARPQAATGFIGDVGERIRNFAITATMVRTFDGDYGTTTLIVGTTDDGHVVKWFASNPPFKALTNEAGGIAGSRGVEPGDVLHFAAATVKAHDSYKGTDQTVLTRGHKVTITE